MDRRRFAGALAAAAAAPAADEKRILLPSDTPDQFNLRIM